MHQSARCYGDDNTDGNINAVVARIGGMEAHLDKDMSHLLHVLHLFEDRLEGVAKNYRKSSPS